MTWNDYGESHYVGPIKGDQPNSQAWTDGMNHTGERTQALYSCPVVHYFSAAWLDLTQYYSTAFKTGKYPTIEKDKIVMWSRPHAGGATSADPVGQPDNFELVCKLHRDNLKYLTCLFLVGGCTMGCRNGY